MKQINSVIEIGTSKIVCAIAEVKDYNSYEIIGLSSVSYAGIKRGEFLNPARLADSIITAVEGAESQANKKIKSAYVGIPGCLIKVACNGADIEVGSNNGLITNQDVEFLANEAQKFFVPEKMQVLHKSPIGFKLSDGKSIVSPIGLRSKYLSGVFSYTTCLKDTTEYLHDVFDHIKIEIEEFVGTPLTLGLMVVPELDRPSISIILDIGYFSTDIIITQGDGILYHTVLNVGGYNIANDLSIVMNIPLSEAEQIKRRYVFGLDTSYIGSKEFFRSNDGQLKTHSNAAIKSVIDARTQELLLLIDKKINTLGLRFNKQTKMYITGGGISMMRGCRELFDSYFKFDVRMPKYETPKINTQNLYSTLSIIEFANKHSATQESVSTIKRNRLLQKILDFFTE